MAASAIAPQEARCCSVPRIGAQRSPPLVNMGRTGDSISASRHSSAKLEVMSPTAIQFVEGEMILLLELSTKTEVLVQYERHYKLMMWPIFSL